MRAAIARDAWTTLEKTYSEAGVNATISHIGELVSVMLADHPSMQSYVDCFIGIAERLATLGREVDDDYKAVFLLKGLTPKFQPLAWALEHSSIKLTSELVINALLNETS